jgi:hypothetical protein
MLLHHLTAQPKSIPLSLGCVAEQRFKIVPPFRDVAPQQNISLQWPSERWKTRIPSGIFLFSWQCDQLAVLLLMPLASLPSVDSKFSVSGGFRSTIDTAMYSLRCQGIITWSQRIWHPVSPHLASPYGQHSPEPWPFSCLASRRVDSTPLQQLILFSTTWLTSKFPFSPIGPAASTNQDVQKTQCWIF